MNVIDNDRPVIDYSKRKEKVRQAVRRHRRRRQHGIYHRGAVLADADEVTE